MGPRSSSVGKAALLALILGAGALVVGVLLPLPPAWFAPVESRRVEDRRGRVLAERVVPERGRQVWVELDEVAPHVLQALVASEDHRFGHHPGVDPVGLVRAAAANLRAGRVVEGGSTLHQQTARLLAPRPPGWWGKGVEAWRAVRLWAHLSDAEVLTWYLNRAYFGRGSYGIAAAARRTFDEAPGALSLSEAATLVGLLPAPSRLHPAVDAEASRAARDRVLDRMERYGALDPLEASRARAEPIELRAPRVDDLAPQFVARVLADDPGQAVVTTTLDLDLQRRVTALAQGQVASLAGRDVTQAAVLVVSLPDLQVRAWVGAADASAADGQVDGVTARRSPGSTLKPLLYAAAFDEGLAPSDVLFDVESRYATTHGAWTPENYDRRFAGPVSARTALASSLNVPAVRVLERLGVASFQGRLEAVGFRARRTATSLGLGLSLGDLEVSLLELASAYAALATDGRVRPLVFVPGSGTPAPGVPLVTPRSAALVTDILADPSARAPGFGRWGPLERPYPAAAKTGTSTGFRDNWAVGYTRSWLVAVWVGNFDGRPMSEVSGVTGAAPLWAQVLDLVETDAEPFSDPPGSERREVCTLSGGAPGPSCPRATDWFPAGRGPAPCAWHVAGCGVAWPAELAGWARDEGLPACALAGGGSEGLAVRWPDEGAVVWIDPRLPAEEQQLPLSAVGPSGASFRWRVDGQDVGDGQVGVRFPWTSTGPGEHVVEIVVDGAPVGRRTVVVRGGP